MHSSLIRVAGATLLSFPVVALADVTGTVDGASGVKPISSLIYGTNQSTIPSTLTRLGGNRWSAYNWETNASNAGSDYQYQNDGFLASSNTPGAAVLPTLQANLAAGRATIVTVPMVGYVSADKNGGGDVRNSGANYLSTRFNQGVAVKPGGAFSLTPNTGDDFVYQDEFVNWVKSNTAGEVLYNLDNEPDLWSSTHAEVHPTATTYAELVQKSVDYAKAIKNVSPNAKVLGAVNYGWTGYRSLQGATDAAGRDFQTYFLQQMKLADAAAGKRLVDALDFHYYSEAQGNNAAGVATRIDGTDVSPGVSAARIQAPRSLWDPTYVENSYITRDTLPANGIAGKAIQLLPRTQTLINANDPGMKMAMGEYSFGGGSDISGGLAEADALGVFGEQGVFSASWWDNGNGSTFVNAAMRMYLNYDGKNGKFGDTSVGSTVSDDGTASVYAATDSATGKLTLVLINKSSAAQTFTLSLKSLGKYGAGLAYGFNGTSTAVNGVIPIAALGNVAIANGTLTFNASALSVTTIALAPEPASIGMVLGGAALASMRRR